MMIKNMNIEQKILEMCEERGVKMTAQRKIIIKAIGELNSQHPDAEDIYKITSNIDKKIGLATVYRTLSFFVNIGILIKLELNDKARYELAPQDGLQHHHIIDIDTGYIIEFYDEELEEIKTKIAHKLGYKIHTHTLKIYGRKINK